MRAASLLVVGMLLIGAVSAGGVATAAECAAGTYEVSGTVVDAVTGAPLGNPITSVSFTGVDDQNTNADGTFAFCLPPGDYTVSFAADGYVIGWYDAVFEADAATVVTVSAGNVGGIDAALYPLPRISGRVTDRRTGAGVHTSVGISDAATGAGLDGDVTDPEGYFSYVVPREYLPGVFAVNFVADSYWAEWYDNARKFKHATAITVTYDSVEITGVDGDLRPCAGTLPCLPRKFNE